MAKNRYINTRLWSDSWIRTRLNPLDRYLFLYFLTNEHSNISGIYELPIDTIAYETGLDQNDLTRSLIPRLRPKVGYWKGWVIIPNFLKHQNQKSPTVQKGIAAEIANVPKGISEKAIELGYPMHTLSHLNSNFNLNLNSNQTAEAGASKKLDLTNAVIDLFKAVNPSYQTLFSRKPQRAAAERLLALHGLEKIEGLLGYVKVNEGSKYLPTITTPCQLEDKLASLEGFARRNNSLAHVVL